jgi:membrane-associated phospholipid phosphatase
MAEPMHRVVAKRARETAIFVGEGADYGRLWLLCGVWLGSSGNEGRTLARRGLQAVAASWALTYGVAKPLLKRRRPADRNLWHLGGADEDSSSFPSSHAATGAAFATAVGRDDWRRGAVIGGLTLLVSYSRVTTGAHHLSDVISGGAIGVGAAVALRRIEAVRQPEVERLADAGLQQMHVGRRRERRRMVAEPALDLHRVSAPRK